MLPLLLPAGAPTYLYAPFSPPQDICVSAPTGSGKTLSYVVPIIEVCTLILLRLLLADVDSTDFESSSGD